MSFGSGYIFRELFQRGAQEAYNNAWNSAWNNNSKNYISAAQRSSSYDDFLNKSGLSKKAKEYQTAYNNSARTLYYSDTNQEVNYYYDRNGNKNYEVKKDDDGNERDTEWRVDTSSISQDLKDAYRLVNDSSKLQSQYTNIRNQYGTVTENADAGTVSTGNVSGVGDSGNGAVASSSGGGRRQGGDMITTDAARSSDSRGGDTLLGYSGRNSLKEKETLF